MAEFNGSLFQIHRGRNEGMYVRSSLDGTNWTAWREIGGSTPNAASIVAFNGRLYATHRGMDNNIYTVSSADGLTWTPAERASGETSDGFAKTPDAVAMTVFNNRLYQAHRGSNNFIYLRSSTDGSRWTGWQQIDGNTPDAISLATFNNKLYVSHRGLDNGIYTRSFDGANWTAWERAPGDTPDAPAMATFANRLYQIHRGLDNEMYMRSTDGSSWTGWQKQGGATLSAPFMTAFRGRFYQTHQGTDDNIYTRSSTDAATWTNWVNGNGSTPVDRAATLTEPNDRLTELVNKPSSLNIDEIGEYRRLVAQRPQGERTQWYRKLQDKTPFFNQRNNRSPGNIADAMCNVTALANCLTYLGIKNPNPSMQFEDYLERLRVNKRYGSREVWTTLARLAKDLGADPVDKGSGITSISFNAEQIKSALDAGYVVMGSIRLKHSAKHKEMRHIVRYQGYDASGFIVDDPFGRATDGTVPYGQKTTYKTQNKKNSDGEDQEGNNNRWDWRFAQRVGRHFLIIRPGSLP
jgi:hypothetical protein